jgi:hypothetical protein
VEPNFTQFERTRHIPAEVRLVVSVRAGYRGYEKGRRSPDRRA